MMSHEETIKAIDEMIEKLRAERIQSEKRTKMYKEQFVSFLFWNEAISRLRVTIIEVRILGGF